ncbi:MAG: hypothetical protein RLY58_1045 [Pseudomonadota bacterium]|jgi:NTE family protein
MGWFDRRAQGLARDLKEAQSYDDWHAIALELDHASGMNLWKLDNASPYYDSSLIAERLVTLRRYRQEGRDVELMRAIREGLYHDLGNIGHPMLYGHAHVGTKRLIEEYIDQVCLCLDYLCDQQFDFLPLDAKYRFFEDTYHSYGQPALMFSGGATLGLFHAGVCKALQDQDLLPKVFSGSSAGSLMAGMLGTRTDDELRLMYNGEHFYEHAFHFRTLRDILRGGGIADVNILRSFLRENLGEYTFEEAFAKSGRHINIAVAPYDGRQQPRIMNELTSPYLLLWSAALASCAVPVLFPPVKLTTKTRDGHYKAYMPSTRWVDGSVRSDFPRERLARLYNINYTIACQVNPHIVPFMKNDHQRFRTDVMSWPARIARKQAQILAMGAMDFARDRMGDAAPIRRMLDHGYGVIGQRYYGDVNIVGDYSLRHYGYMLRDPSPELFQLLMKEGERATWPKISAIRTHARIGKTLDQCLARLDQKREQLLADDSLSVPDAHGSHDAGILQIEARRRHRSQVS